MRDRVGEIVVVGLAEAAVAGAATWVFHATINNAVARDLAIITFWFAALGVGAALLWKRWAGASKVPDDKTVSTVLEDTAGGSSPTTGSARQQGDTALLRLHIYGDERVPDRLALENIFRWYFLSVSMLGIESNGVQRVRALEILFVSFESEVVISTLRVTSPDMKLPAYEVKEFNQRFAIITFMEPLSAGTLEIQVVS